MHMKREKKWNTNVSFLLSVHRKIYDMRVYFCEHSYVCLCMCACACCAYSIWIQRKKRFRLSPWVFFFHLIFLISCILIEECIEMCDFILFFYQFSFHLTPFPIIRRLIQNYHFLFKNFADLYLKIQLINFNTFICFSIFFLIFKGKQKKTKIKEYLMGFNAL